MGIRVRKFLGYGLTDIKTRKYRIADGRINPKNLLINDYQDKATVEGYLAFLESKLKDREFNDPHATSIDYWMRKEILEDRRKYSMWDTYAYQGEYGDKKVLVLKPLSCADWSRHDDMIDYQQETYIYQKEEDYCTSHVEVFEHGIYPWSGNYMNTKTGELVKDGIQWVQYNWPSFKDLGLDYNELAKSFGFEDEADIRANFAPMVPSEIRYLAEYTKLFTNDDVWKQLRPMLYTYWS